MVLLKDSYWCRQCSESGGTIKYLMGRRHMTYQDASDYLNLNRGISHTVQQPSPKRKNVKKKRWYPSAMEFVERCNRFLLRDQVLLKQILQRRGINKKTLKRFKLGWNPHDQFVDRKGWGLPKKLKKDGSGTKLCLPAGLVIPYCSGRKVKRVRIRREHNTEKYGKYHLVGEITADPLVIRSDKAPDAPTFITEGELDAILLAQEVTEAKIVGLQSTTISIDPDTKLFEELSQAEWIALVVDNDEAGKILAEKLMEMFPQAVYTPVTEQAGKDITEAYLNGLDLLFFSECVCAYIMSGKN